MAVGKAVPNSSPAELIGVAAGFGVSAAAVLVEVEEQQQLANSSSAVEHQRADVCSGMLTDSQAADGSSSSSLNIQPVPSKVGAPLQTTSTAGAALPLPVNDSMAAAAAGMIAVSNSAVTEHSHTQQQPLRQQQQAVLTAGMPFTLVTSVLGEHGVAAAAAGSSTKQLQQQLQQLEVQAAQLASVDLVETPRLAQDAAAACAASGIGSSHAKKVTASTARAAAKHLQCPSAAATVDSSATGSYTIAASTEAGITAYASVAVGGKKRSCSKQRSTGVAALPVVSGVCAGCSGKHASSAVAQEAAAVERANILLYSNDTVVRCAQPAAVTLAGVAAADRASAGVVAAADDAKIVSAATRAGPAHMQDIWA
jgi:hypothetical protein